MWLTISIVRGYSMKQFNQDMIRDYLLKRIAKKNKRISGALKEVVKSNRGSYNNGFNEILGFFANGLNGETMTQIFEHIEENQSKRYSPYHYFDVDTLNAYDTYLQRILTETDVVAYGLGHKKTTASDFHRGFAEAKSVWRSLAREKSSKNGYYNSSKPITVVETRRNGVTELSPKKPLIDEQFAKKYDEVECSKELYAYLQMKHKGIDVSTPVEQPKEREQYSFDYRGRTLRLEVISKEYYTDIEGRGLTSITAEGREGRLYTTNYNDGRVYNGDLFDFDGNLVQVDGGGQVFYENKSFYDAFKSKKGRTATTSEESQYKEDEDGQMYLF